MADIKTFSFLKGSLNKLKEYHFGLNWPVVYIQENGKEMYIGQTTNLYNRSKTHLETEDRARLKRIHVLTDEEFNVSSALDFESLLIQYISADQKFKLQNGNGGLINHNYYDKEKYLGKLEVFWSQLQKEKLVQANLPDLRNSEFFKYSPFKGLTEEQKTIADELVVNLKLSKPQTYVINGGPGTGKSILALNLLKRLSDEMKGKDFKVALVIPMSGLRATLQRVVKRVPNLGIGSVIGPSDVVKQKYDLLIVDEAHRLRRRVNLTNFSSYDATNTKLGLPQEATQLDWIIASAEKRVFFYDKRQSVVPADVRPEDFTALDSKQYELTSQMRVEGGEDYLAYVDNLLDLKQVGPFSSNKYEFKIYDDIRTMDREIRNQNSKHSLARLVAGYAWPWNTSKGKSDFDIEIEGLKLVWNSTNADWINTPNSINEVGCIHTVQGYDLNYVGVIIGPEVSYNSETGKVVVDPKKYKDFNGKRSITHEDELHSYVINIYKTLLTRGIKGTYVYIVDEKLRQHVERLVSGNSNPISMPVLSPYIRDLVQVPLVGSAPCGNPIFGEENIVKYIPVSKEKLKVGFEYFILRAEGDSMNLAGIQDGDLVLCRQQIKAETGDRVVALLGDNVTIKMYDKRDGRRVLLPKSSNTEHQPIIPNEGDVVQGVVQEILDSEKE